jgi:predicted kinase
VAGSSQRPILIVFSGLPGAGKTTISQALAGRRGAVYVRIDAIEQAMKATGLSQIGPAGYVVANALALANLQLGHCVVADCVNPVGESRRAWRNVADQAGAHLIDIHLICSDPAEHRRRVEGRLPDIPDHRLPTWEQVLADAFEPRDDDHMSLDTASMSPEELVDCCEAYIWNKAG